MAWGDKKNDKRANGSPFNAGDPTMPWDISSSTKAYKNRAQDPFGEPAEDGVSAPVVESKAASEQTNRSAHPAQPGGQRDRAGQRAAEPLRGDRGERLVGALQDALGADVDPRAGRHLAEHRQA